MSWRTALVRHHLIDFGSALGSGGVGPADWEGQAYMYEGGQVAKSALTLGMAIPEWRHTRFLRVSGGGPDARPRVPVRPGDVEARDPERGVPQGQT